MSKCVCEYGCCLGTSININILRLCAKTEYGSASGAHRERMFVSFGYKRVKDTHHARISHVLTTHANAKTNTPWRHKTDKKCVISGI